MGINIGNNNKITNSNICENGTVPKNKKTFAEKHPIFIGLMCFFIIGVLLMFSFWKDIISFLEGLI